MTNNEYKELRDSLYYGHEVEFEYNGKHFHYQPVNDSVGEIWLKKDNQNELVTKIEGIDINDVVDKFLFEGNIIDKKAIADLYQQIEILYIW